MRNHLAFGFEEFSNAFSKDDLTIAASFSPVMAHHTAHRGQHPYH